MYTLVTLFYKNHTMKKANTLIILFFFICLTLLFSNCGAIKKNCDCPDFSQIEKIHVKFPNYFMSSVNNLI